MCILPATVFTMMKYRPRATPRISQDSVYGTAEVENVEIPEDQAGFIKRIRDVNVGSFPKSTQQEITGAGQNLLVFIHGFDNSFPDAITRAAFNREWWLP